jgi:hypothetical protein
VSLQARIQIGWGQLEAAAQTLHNPSPNPDDMDAAITLFARASLALITRDPQQALVEAEAAGRQLNRRLRYRQPRTRAMAPDRGAGPANAGRSPERQAKTVQTHLANSYRKLDIISRRELPAALGRQGFSQAPHKRSP